MENVTQTKPRLTWAELKTSWIEYASCFGETRHELAEQIFADVDRHLNGEPTMADLREGRS